jgi:hypothetical protein
LQHLPQELRRILRAGDGGDLVAADADVREVIQPLQLVLHAASRHQLSTASPWRARPDRFRNEPLRRMLGPHIGGKASLSSLLPVMGNSL